MAELRYSIELGGRWLEVTLEREEGKIFAQINGKRIPVELKGLGGHGVYALALGDARESMILTRRDGRYQASLAGREISVAVEASAIQELRRHLKATSTESSAQQIIRSHMPGLIVKIRVKPGQEVKSGEGLLVIEAMKMENEIRAPQDGVIEKITVQERQEVKGGQPLLVLKPTEAGEVPHEP